MIDGWGVFYNCAWVVGLAAVLAAFSLASCRAHGEKVRLREKLGGPGFRVPFGAGVGLFCLGLLFSGRAWWEQVLWGALAVAFAVQALAGLKKAPRGSVTPAAGESAVERAREAGHGPALSRDGSLAEVSLLRRAAVALASVEIWPVVALVAASVVTARVLPWALGVAGLFWAVRWLARGRLSVRTPADWAVAWLVLTVPVTLWATAQPQTTRPQVARLLAGLALYYAVVNWTTCRARLRWLVAGTVLAGLVLALYAPISVDWTMGKFSFVPRALYGRFVLLASDTVNPNVMSGNLAILLPWPLAWLLFGRGRLRWLDRLLAGLAASLMAVAMILTQSRGALIGLGAAVVTLALLRWRRGWLLLVAVAIVGALFVQAVGLTAALDALTVSGTVGRLEGRLEVWSRALYMIQDFPFTGAGMGTFGPVADVLYPFFLVAPGQVPHAHNLFLQVAVDLGIPGLIAWLAILALVAVAAWQVYQHGRAADDGWVTGLGAGILGSQMALAVHGLTDAVTWGMVRPAPVVWGLWGLAMAGWRLYGGRLKASR